MAFELRENREGEYRGIAKGDVMQDGSRDPARLEKVTLLINIEEFMIVISSKNIKGNIKRNTR